MFFLHNFLILTNLSLCPVFLKGIGFRKGLEPKKPREAERGEGCADSSTKCLEESISFAFLRASPPHKRKTLGVRHPKQFYYLICQGFPDFPLCALDFISGTVSTALSNKTLAQPNVLNLNPFIKAFALGSFEY